MPLERQGLPCCPWTMSSQIPTQRPLSGASLFLEAFPRCLYPQLLEVYLQKAPTRWAFWLYTDMCITNPSPPILHSLLLASPASCPCSSSLIPGSKCYFCLYFTDEETEGTEGLLIITLPLLTSPKVGRPGVEPRQSSSKFMFLTTPLGYVSGCFRGEKEMPLSK